MAGRPRARPLPPLATIVVGLWFGAAPCPARADVQGWVEQLGAPQFARREAAARSLVEAGRTAIEPLERAIRGGDLEIASRGVDILRQLLDAPDADVARGAEEGLERLAAGTGDAARLAASAVEFHRLGRSTAARQRLESLGACVRERPAVEGRGLEVEIAAAWHGTPADIRQVAGLQRLAAVSIHGVPVDAATLDALGRLQSVQRIDLYGTGAGDAEARMLAARLPNARIDVRRGGRLGVSSATISGPCEIRTVEPGSAADQAGLRSGDVILSIDGAEVANFDDLTVRLGERAAGEVLRLAVARRGGTADGDPERIECEVRLDAW